MTGSREKFKQLLKEALYRIKSRNSGKKMSIIIDELGYDMGRDGGSISQHYRRGKGNLPSSVTDAENLTRALVKQGGCGIGARQGHVVLRKI